MRQLDMQQIFNREVAVPNINTYDELAAALREFQAFENDSDLTRSMNELRAITGTDQVNIGIKDALLALDEAKQEGGDIAERFAEVVAQRMASL